MTPKKNPDGSRYKTSRVSPDCHPDRAHHANGQCRECYNKSYFESWIDANGDRHAARNKSYMRKYLTDRTLADPNFRKKLSLSSIYGITIDQYFEMGESQGWLCAICGQPETVTRKGVVQSLSIDHDHDKRKGDPGFIRSLLCNRCNTSIGKFEDNILLLEAAIEYLKKYKK